MEIRLFDSELRVMEVLWQRGDLTAKEISEILKEQVGWNKNTTYTVIKKCVDKGAVERREPNFLCHALIPKLKVQQEETKALIDRMFDGSGEMFFSSFVKSRKLSREKIEELLDLIEDGER